MAFWKFSQLDRVWELELKNVCGGTDGLYLPTGGAKCSVQLTGVVFVRGLSLRGRAPSLCSVFDT